MDARQKRCRALARLAGVVVLVALTVVGGTSAVAAAPVAASGSATTATDPHAAPPVAAATDPAPAGVLARTGSPLGLLVAAGLSLLAVGSVATAELRRPRRRATDPRIRHRIASLLDRTP